MRLCYRFLWEPQPYLIRRCVPFGLRELINSRAKTKFILQYEEVL